MYTEVIKIADFILKAFLHIWPYLLITIPLAAGVRMSGAANYISRALGHRPYVSIFLATIVGAFSPFCSCGVIPVVASLLLGGVPLAPVMSFWIASPSMDPEIFFLSAATLGWKLAMWRLLSTLALSLSAGFITHYLIRKNRLGNDYLKIGQSRRETLSLKMLYKSAVDYIRSFSVPELKKVPAGELCCVSARAAAAAEGGSSTAGKIMPLHSEASSSCNCSSSTAGRTGLHGNSGLQEISLPVINEAPEGKLFNAGFLQRLKKETLGASLMVMKFMGLAFLLEAVIELYVPQELITGTMGGDNPLSVLWAAILGVPVYTSNLAALPLIGGLIAKGMNEGAALAFLISGPVTTIPAMAAVYGLVNKKVFMLYVSFAFFGALIMGYLFYAVG